jgi:hypothetical protein
VRVVARLGVVADLHGRRTALKFRMGANVMIIVFGDFK